MNTYTLNAVNTLLRVGSRLTVDLSGIRSQSLGSGGIGGRIRWLSGDVLCTRTVVPWTARALPSVIVLASVDRHVSAVGARFASNPLSEIVAQVGAEHILRHGGVILRVHAASSSAPWSLPPDGLCPKAVKGKAVRPVMTPASSSVRLPSVLMISLAPLYP